MPASDRLAIVRDCYRAYESNDRQVLEQRLSEDFTFFSPVDPGIDRARYFERCWPNSEAIGSFELTLLVEHDDRVVATYVAGRADGTRFQNTEVHTFRDDKICKVEVYFGWDLE